MNSVDWERSATNYYSDVISPIKDTSQDFIFKDLERFSSKEKSVIDLGCGVGELLPFLSANFKLVYGVDFSKKMIDQSKKKVIQMDNVYLFVDDLKKINLTEEFDLVVSINSILSPNSNSVNKIINNCYNLTKVGGKFLCVLPSIESYIYQSMIAKDYKKVSRKKITDFKQNFDLSNGIINFDGDKQKAFYRFEAIYRLKKAGFKKIKISRLNYSWKSWKDAGQYFFPKEENPWDWYLIAEK